MCEKTCPSASGLTPTTSAARPATANASAQKRRIRWMGRLRSLTCCDATAYAPMSPEPGSGLTRSRLREEDGAGAMPPIGTWHPHAAPAPPEDPSAAAGAGTGPLLPPQPRPRGTAGRPPLHLSVVIGYARPAFWFSVWERVSNDYHFITRWRVKGTAAEVAGVLRDAEELPRWWPSVYLDVRVIEEGDARGVGRVVDLWTKGWLPYTLRWRFTTTRNDGAAGLALRADGDFVGEGVWTFTQHGAFVEAEYDWRIAAEKPLLKRLTWLLRPAFSANHRCAMRKGEESMRLEVERRRLPPDEATQVPAPPGPTFRWLASTRKHSKRS